MTLTEKLFTALGLRSDNSTDSTPDVYWEVYYNEKSGGDHGHWAFTNPEVAKAFVEDMYPAVAEDSTEWERSLVNAGRTLWTVDVSERTEARVVERHPNDAMYREDLPVRDSF